MTVLLLDGWSCWTEKHSSHCQRPFCLSCQGGYRTSSLKQHLLYFWIELLATDCLLAHTGFHPSISFIQRHCSGFAGIGSHLVARLQTWPPRKTALIASCFWVLCGWDKSYSSVSWRVNPPGHRLNIGIQVPCHKSVPQTSLVTCCIWPLSRLLKDLFNFEWVMSKSYHTHECMSTRHIQWRRGNKGVLWFSLG